MTKQKAIAKKCLECSGDSPKEVTLCHFFKCPLWKYRCGYHIKTTRYKKRLEIAQGKYSRDFKELSTIGINIAFFILHDNEALAVEKNRG